MLTFERNEEINRQTLSQQDTAACETQATVCTSKHQGSMRTWKRGLGQTTFGTAVSSLSSLVGRQEQLQRLMIGGWKERIRCLPQPIPLEFLLLITTIILPRGIEHRIDTLSLFLSSEAPTSLVIGTLLDSRSLDQVGTPSLGSILPEQLSRQLVVSLRDLVFTGLPNLPRQNPALTEFELPCVPSDRNPN